MPNLTIEDIYNAHDDERSFVDPVTNWVGISGLNFARDGAKIIQVGKYPRQVLPQFLHELIHHWCFHSPVGAALSLLQLRARQKAFLYSTRSDVTHEDLMSLTEDVLRYECAIGLMRPLAEGLALFGEYDVLPGNSTAVSIPLQTVSALFVQHDEKGSVEDAWDKTRDFLIEMRASELYARRKFSILSAPFSAEKGGYLPGYLMLKNAWRFLMTRLLVHEDCDKLTDSDLFMSYVRSFFYEDYGFVAILLDPDNRVDPFGFSIDDPIQAMLYHFQRRLGQLAEVTSREVIERFEESVSIAPDLTRLFKPGDELPGYTARIPPLDTRLTELGKKRLQTEIRNVSSIKTNDPIEAALLRQFSFTLAQRDLMCIGSFTEKIEVNEHQRVHIGDSGITLPDGRSFPLLSMGGLENVTPDSGMGSIEFFLAPSGRYSVHTVSLNGKVVALSTRSAHLPKEIESQILQYTTSLNDARALNISWKKLIEHALDDYEVNIYREHYRKVMTTAREHIYLQRALTYTPDAQLAACINALRVNGIYDILRTENLGGLKKTNVLQALAVLSLSPVPVMPLNLAHQMLSGIGVSLESVLEVSRRAEIEYGFPLVRSHKAEGNIPHTIAVFV